MDKNLLVIHIVVVGMKNNLYRRFPVKRRFPRSSFMTTDMPTDQAQFS